MKAKGQSKVLEEFTDGGIISLAQSGNKQAIQVLYADLAVRLKSGGIRDNDIVSMLTTIFESIGNGKSPNEAFGWKQTTRGRPKENHELRDFLIKMAVLELLKKGQSNSSACFAVSSDSKNSNAFPLGQKSIEDICEGLTKNSSIALPDQTFQIRRLKRRPGQEIK